MALSIQGSVGEGGRNTSKDVKMVQGLLNAVPVPDGGPAVQLVVDGSVGRLTRGAIRAFQTKHFGSAGTDGRVDPGKQTFQRLLARMTPFRGFTAAQVSRLRADITRAQRMIDNVISLTALAPFLNGNTDPVRMLAFNFDIDFTDKSNPVEFALNSAFLVDLQRRFLKLRDSLAETVPFVAEPAPAAGFFGADAWVVLGDPTVHISLQYFSRPGNERSTILAHERAHTIFDAPGHPGMGGGLAVLIVDDPRDDKRPLFQPQGRFHEQAINNPFCYEWLILTLDNGASAKEFNPGCLCATAV